jgi:hypothetical protein
VRQPPPAPAVGGGWVGGGGGVFGAAAGVRGALALGASVMQMPPGSRGFALCEQLLSQQPPQAARSTPAAAAAAAAGVEGEGAPAPAIGGGSGSAATPTLSWSYRVLRVLQLQHHVPAELVPGPGAARLVFACGALHPLNRFVRHGLRLPVAQQAPSLVLDGVTITDELTLELVQAHAASAPAGMTAGTPALLVSRVVLAVLTPGAAGKASLLPSYVVDYALEALTAQLFDGN